MADRLVLRRALILVRFAAFAAALVPAGAFGATHATSGTEARQQHFEYDGCDRQFVARQPTAGFIERPYDGAGRVARERALDATHGLQSERQRGQLVEVQDAAFAPIARFDDRADGALVRSARGAPVLGVSTEALVSLAGEPLGRVSAEGVRVEAALDAQRRLRGTGPGASRRRTLSYDSAQRLTRVDEADGSARVMSSFEAHGQPQQVGLPGGAGLTLGYDVLGRLTTRQPSAGVAESFGYDVLGRLVTVPGTVRKSLR